MVVSRQMYVLTELRLREREHTSRLLYATVVRGLHLCARSGAALRAQISALRGPLPQVSDRAPLMGITG